MHTLIPETISCVKAIPILGILNHLGISVKGGRRGMYTSPFRDESNPSFHINDRNQWYDFGLSKGGDTISLVMQLRNCSFPEAVAFLQEISPSITPEDVTASPFWFGQHRQQSNPISIIKTGPINRPQLLAYARTRGIGPAYLRQYTEEVDYSCKNKTYYAIGFRNNSGGYVLRSKYFKGTTKSDITTMDSTGIILKTLAQSSSALVFEGFFNFLSYLALNSIYQPHCDVLVLNSVSNTDKAMPWLRLHEEIICYLDNDDAGKRTFEKIRSSISESSVIDKSGTYDGLNDLNDVLMSKLNSYRNGRL